MPYSEALNDVADHHPANDDTYPEDTAYYCDEDSFCDGHNTPGGRCSDMVPEHMLLPKEPDPWGADHDAIIHAPSAPLGR